MLSQTLSESYKQIERAYPSHYSDIRMDAFSVETTIFKLNSLQANIISHTHSVTGILSI